MAVLPIPSIAQWTWDTSTNPPACIGFNNGSPTKTGLQASDLQNFVGVPTILNFTPPQEVSVDQLQTYIRDAEDWVEQQTGILLCQTWIASPPVDAAQASNIQLLTTSTNGQHQGIDYDLVDIGYDFYFRRFLAEGWGAQQLRYRPLKNIYSMSFVYPLLSEFFKVPLSWVVEDYDFAAIRVVPAANVQMLPLFAMQLAFMGFASSLPQAMYYQYIAGLSNIDYDSRFSFMKQLVLSVAGIWLLRMLQGSINFGAIKTATRVDGLSYEQSFPTSGSAYGGLISQFTSQRDELMRTAIDLVRGPTWISL